MIWFTVAAAAVATVHVTYRMDAFAAKVAAWRDVSSPISADDLPRTAVSRPLGWASNVTKAALHQRAIEREQLTAELQAVTSRVDGEDDFAEWSAADQVDYWAVSGRLARAFWEAEVVRSPWRDPMWYVLQGPGAVWDSLVRTPSEWSDSRIMSELLPRVNAIAPVLSAGRENLEYSGAAIKNHALVALDTLACTPAAGCSLAGTLVKALVAVGGTAPGVQQELKAAGASAAAAIQAYGAWLQQKAPTFSANTSVGEGAYLWYLTHVAMTNTSAAQIADFGKAEFARAHAALVIEKHRNDMAGLPPLPVLSSLSVQMAATSAAQAEIKAYAAAQRLFTVPEWLPNYTVVGPSALLASEKCRVSKMRKYVRGFPIDGGCWRVRHLLA